jgi:hypothetical protein
MSTAKCQYGPEALRSPRTGRIWSCSRAVVRIQASCHGHHDRSRSGEGKGGYRRSVVVTHARDPPAARRRLPLRRGARSESLGPPAQSAASATRNGAAGECEHVGEASPGMWNTGASTSGLSTQSTVQRDARWNTPEQSRATPSRRSHRNTRRRGPRRLPPPARGGDSRGDLKLYGEDLGR